jgi:ABC-type glutathione transport system ATPase component
MADPNTIPVPVSSSKSSGITKLTESCEGIALDNISQAADVDNYTTDISFRTVDAVDVSVRNLSISVSQTSKWLLKLPWTKSGGEGQQPIKILDDVSADVPAGQLMAIIGSSGSGKVNLLLDELVTTH